MRLRRSELPLRSLPFRSVAIAASFLLVVGVIALDDSPADALGGNHSFGCAGGEFEQVVVPEGVDRVRISAGGGSGATGTDGKARGGKGGLVEGTFPVAPGDEIRVTVGCSANGQNGGRGYANGGNGGHSGAYSDGGGGGGSTAVQRGTPLGEFIMLAVAPGGGGGGGSGYANTGARGQDGGPSSQYDHDHWVAETGWKSTGGAGGGGGGAGAPAYARPGEAGHGGNHLGDWGGSGKGGRPYVDRNGTSDIREVDGGAPYGSGFAIVTFLERGGIVPLTSTFPCAAGVRQPYTVPVGVHLLEIIATGGAGANNWETAKGGSGARVTGSLAVTPGQEFSVVSGCAGGIKSGGGGDDDEIGGAGYGRGGGGGDGPSGSVAGRKSYGGGGGGSSALLFEDGTPALVAGGGGGAAGVIGSGGIDGGDGSLAGETGHSGDAAGGSGGSALGKDGRSGSNGAVGGAGGGGGGGYHGGDGGRAGGAGEDGGGGGGGSSYTATEVDEPEIVAGGGGDGNGFVLILAVVASVPSAVQSATAVPQNGSARITFSAPASDGNSSIREYVITDNRGATMRTDQPGTVTFPRLVNGDVYTFAIVAVNDIGQSSPVTVSARPRTVPSAPSDLKVAFGDERLTVSFDEPWDGGSPITSYTVVSSDGHEYNITANPLVIGRLTNGEKYTYRVYASNAAGDGPLSAPVTGVPRAVPDAPTIVVAYPDAGGMQLVVQPGDANGAEILNYVATAHPADQAGAGDQTETGDRIAIGDPASGLVSFTGLTDGVAYTFTVQAVNAVGVGPASDPYGPVEPSSLPSSPVNLRAVAGDGSATITFDPPLETHGEPVLEYRVYGADGSFILAADSSPIIIQGLTNGTEYAFQLRARTAFGLGAESAAAFVTPVARPGNDDEANTIWLDPAGGTITGSTVNATTEPDEVAPGIGTTIWYALAIPEGVGGAYRIDLCDSPSGATMSVFGGYGAVGEAFDCAGGGSAASYVTDVPASGLTLFIQVDATDAPGDVTVHWRSLNAGLAQARSPEALLDASAPLRLLVLEGGDETESVDGSEEPEAPDDVAEEPALPAEPDPLVEPAPLAEPVALAEPVVPVEPGPLAEPAIGMLPLRR